MNIIYEINCLGACLKLSDLTPFIAMLLAVSIALLAARAMHKNPEYRLIIYVSAQVAVLLAIFTTFYIMRCSEMLTAYLYLAYASATSLLIFVTQRFYDRIMVRRLDAKPIGGVLKWVQEFVDTLVNATVYYYDSSIPRAFACGKSIFVSIGLLEMLDETELKAVLAHEAWHLRSSRFLFKQLAFMTFSSQKEVETLADCFAAKIAGNKALISARNKVKVFI